MADHAPQVLTELLVLRAQAGHRDAAGMLVRIWQERLLRHAQRLTGRDDAAGDVLQDAWLDIVRGLRGLDDPARFGPWAYTIVSRGCALWIRRQQRRRLVERDAAAQHEAPPEPSPASDATDAVRSALSRLPADQQTILELRYAEDFGIHQIAEVLGIPPGTVKSRLFHAREQLRNILTQVTQ